MDFAVTNIPYLSFKLCESIHSRYPTNHSQAPTGWFVLDVAEWMSKDEATVLWMRATGNILYTMSGIE